MVIVVDDEDRENEGDITIAAQHCTPEHVAFMRKHCSGVVCVALSPEAFASLVLPPIVERNTARLWTAFTVSVVVAAGVTTGVIAAERARTCSLLAAPASRAADLV